MDVIDIAVGFIFPHFSYPLIISVLRKHVLRQGRGFVKEWSVREWRRKKGLLERGVSPVLLNVTYYGATDNKSTNSYKDVERIIVYSGFLFYSEGAKIGFIVTTHYFLQSLIIYIRKKKKWVNILNKWIVE